MVKEGIRILGVDDAEINGRILIVGVVWKLSNRVDGVISFYIEKDGLDMTEKLIKAVKSSRFGKTINVLMTNGISFGGFNLLDVEEFFEETMIPTIIVISKRPAFDKILKALKKFKDFEKRWEIIKKAGEVKEIKIGGSKIYFQHYGIPESDAKILIKKSAIHSKIPEPVRLAHVISSGICKGESSRKI